MNSRLTRGSIISEDNGTHTRSFLAAKLFKFFKETICHHLLVSDQAKRRKQPNKTCFSSWVNYPRLVNTVAWTSYLWKRMYLLRTSAICPTGIDQNTALIQVALFNLKISTTETTIRRFCSKSSGAKTGQTGKWREWNWLKWTPLSCELSRLVSITPFLHSFFNRHTHINWIFNSTLLGDKSIPD